MNWYRMRIQEGKDTYTYAGSSELSIEQLLERARQGQFIRLESLVYLDRGDIKDWSTWDRREIPTVHMNPKFILAVHQFKADPRTLER
jgi:hypothetical protein